MPMDRPGLVAFAVAACALAAPAPSRALTVDYDFTFAYSGMTIRGRLVGMDLDANGNGTEIDPRTIELFQVPSQVGLPASDAHPYVLTPVVFGRLRYGSGEQTTTQRGVYGFGVSNFVLGASPNVLLSDAGFDVFMEVRYGDVFTGGPITGINGEETALWPSDLTSATFTLVAVPEPPAAVLFGAGAGALWLRGRRRSTTRTHRALRSIACYQSRTRSFGAR
jgi:hypothetical protein